MRAAGAVLILNFIGRFGGRQLCGGSRPGDDALVCVLPGLVGLHLVL
jgi:hypothetical protein